MLLHCLRILVTAWKNTNKYQPSGKKIYIIQERNNIKIRMIDEVIKKHRAGIRSHTPAICFAFKYKSEKNTINFIKEKIQGSAHSLGACRCSE